MQSTFLSVFSFIPFHISEEFRDCRSIKGRFQQYFVHGDSLDCASWEHDFEDCLRYTEKNDLAAGKKVIDNETARRKERLKAHYGNNVWKKRDGPPEDWAKPLPDHLMKKYENSFLDIKNKEMKGEKSFYMSFVVLMSPSFFQGLPISEEASASSSMQSTSFCTIM